MTYEDPRSPNPKFPGRPHENPDYQLLSDVVQGMDLRADVNADLSEISGLDNDVLLYFVHHRLGQLATAQRQANMPVTVNPNDPVQIGTYIDALTVGKLFAEAKARQ